MYGSVTSKLEFLNERAPVMPHICTYPVSMNFVANIAAYLSADRRRSTSNFLDFSGC
jgi:hypothetical protein